jgi:hypothetical protein
MKFAGGICVALSPWAETPTIKFAPLNKDFLALQMTTRPIAIGVLLRSDALADGYCKGYIFI